MEKKAIWTRNEMEKKSLIFRILYGWRDSFLIAIKAKNPVFRRKTGQLLHHPSQPSTEDST
jgi:hypothetical protein